MQNLSLYLTNFYEGGVCTNMNYRQKQITINHQFIVVC